MAADAQGRDSYDLCELLDLKIPINLYVRLGFRPCRHVYNDPYVALLVPLVMILNDRDYLRRVGSPLLGTAFDPDLPTSQVARQAASLLPIKPPVRSLEHVAKYDWSSQINAGMTRQALRVFEGLDDSQTSQVLAGSHIIDVASNTVP